MGSQIGSEHADIEEGMVLVDQKCRRINEMGLEPSLVNMEGVEVGPLG